VRFPNYLWVLLDISRVFSIVNPFRRVVTKSSEYSSIVLMRYNREPASSHLEPSLGHCTTPRTTLEIGSSYNHVISSKPVDQAD